MIKNAIPKYAIMMMETAMMIFLISRRLKESQDQGAHQVQIPVISMDGDDWWVYALIFAFAAIVIGIVLLVKYIRKKR